MRTPKRMSMVLAMLVGMSIPLRAADWQVRRNTSNGACSLQPSDSQPPLGTLLSTKPTKKDACQDAKALKTDDAADTTKCFTYTNNTVALCKAEGVQLTQ
jgi:hypothetical protein